MVKIIKTKNGTLKAGEETASNPFELEGFIEGAEWADAHPSLYSVTRTREAVEREREYLIRKACEWLKRNFNMPDDFESHFKKAMEK